MKIISWNVNSIRIRKQQLLQLIKNETPDFVCIQEIKSSNDVFPKKQILIIDFNDKKSISEKISNFLSIDFDNDFFDFSERINSNKAPKNLISKYFQRNRQITTVLKKYLPKKIINKFEPYLYSNEIRIQYSDEEKKILEELLIKDWTSFQKMVS